MEPNGSIRNKLKKQVNSLQNKYVFSGPIENLLSQFKVKIGYRTILYNQLNLLLI